MLDFRLLMQVRRMTSGRGRRARFQVVVAGAGVAALETALGLHKLAGDTVALTLVAPVDEFVYRPAAVLEPFVARPPRRWPLARLAADVNATLVSDSVASVDSGQRRMATSGGSTLRYDALLLAVGARDREVPPGAVAVHGGRIAESLQGVLKDIEAGSIAQLAFVAPRRSWPLPAYELAFLTAEHARDLGAELEITVITAESSPLAAFGSSASTGVANLLAGAGIRVLANAELEVRSGELQVVDHEAHLPAFDRIVAMPELAGPSIPGLPADPAGFLPIDSHAAVRGVERVFAAGDATDFPVKHGGISALQADAAAESIAALAGLPVEPEPFAPRVYGMLVTGREGPYYYLSALIEDGDPRDSQISDQPDWPPGAKVAARYLAPYLDERWASGLRWLHDQQDMADASGLRSARP